MHGLGRKLLGGFFLIVLIMFVINQPLQAAESTSGIGQWLSHAGTAVGDFLNALF